MSAADPAEPVPDPADPAPEPAEPTPGQPSADAVPAADVADDRESAYGLLERGHALARHRHHAQAAIVLERAAGLEPGKGSILEPLGRAYYASRQFERAARTFEDLLEIDPTSHWAHYALSQALRRLGRPDAARTHLRLAAALSPTTELYRRALGSLEPESRP